VGAILPEPNGAYSIKEDECVECGVCLRSAGCPHGCFTVTPSPWPRSLRSLFSNPLVEHRDTRVPGRGTEEMKTNDVTARFLPGQIGLMIEVGRPALGARLRDVERITMALARIGIEIHPCNPLRGLIEDPKSGRLFPEVLEEKVLSVIVECIIAEDRLHAVLDTIRRTARGLRSVCTVGLIRRFEDPHGIASGESPREWARRQALPVAPNGKVNLAMGRAPLPTVSLCDALAGRVSASAGADLREQS